MRRVLPLFLLVIVALSGCAGHAATRPSAVCSPPAGGRCAHDVAWGGPIVLSPDGRRLHQVIVCSGRLHATETAHRVYLRLHVGAMGAGTMSCPKVVVSVRLASPLGHRTVVDSVSHHVIRVVQTPRTDPLIR